MSDRTRLVARLGSELPRRIAVGKGTALFLDGICNAEGKSITELRVRIGDCEARTAGFGMPSPGSTGRGDYWWATVPIEPVARITRVPVALSGVAGREPFTVHLASSQLEPDLPRVDSPGGDPTTSLAICMATFDPPAGLFERQIDSIREQTRDDWTCLISDDASSAEALAMMKEVIDGDRRFRLVPASARLGFYRNFERALSLVPPGTRLIGLADQDDRWHPEKLERLVSAIDAGAMLAYSDMRLVDPDGTLIADSFWRYRKNNHTDLLSLLIANTITGSTMLFRRELLEFALPFPPRVADTFHDHWIALSALAMGRITYVDEPLIDYVQHPEAAIGHAGANRAGLARRAEGRLARSRRRWHELRRRRMHPGWRSHYFNLYSQMAVLARVLDRRLGPAIAPGKRAELRRFVDVDSSSLSALWLAARTAAGRFDPRVTLRRERYVLRGLAWRRMGRAREATRRAVAPGRANTDADITDATPDSAERWLTPIIIDHAGRDGSTALLALLASSPQVITPPILPRVDPAAEQPYFAYLWRWAHLLDGPISSTTTVHGGAATDASALLEDRGPVPMGPPPWPARDLFEAPGAAPFGRQAFLQAWTEFSRRAVGRAVSAGDEPPRYYAERQFGAWRADLNGLGHVEVLALLRDPRDSYASLLEYERIRGISAPDELSAEAARHRALTFIDDQRERLRWLASDAGIEKATVRYERLVFEPASVAREIGDRLSVRLSPDPVIDDPSLRKMCATSTAVEGSVGRWRQDLDPAVGRLFWSELGAELKALGFDP